MGSCQTLSRLHPSSAQNLSWLLVRVKAKVLTRPCMMWSQGALCESNSPSFISRDTGFPLTPQTLPRHGSASGPLHWHFLPTDLAWLPHLTSSGQIQCHLLQKSVTVTQSCLTLCDPMDCNPPGSSVHGILQARILEWVAIPFFKGSSRPRDGTQVSCIAGEFFTI